MSDEGEVGVVIDSEFGMNSKYIVHLNAKLALVSRVIIEPQRNRPGRPHPSQPI